ncbi:MAG: lactate racemase domain-containing protein [Lentimicrobiaceae bacterium]|nr:lactate racemase domain-containing protein [Lentimicrobiaceae bacterium]
MIFFAEGKADLTIEKQDISKLLEVMLGKLENLKRVLILPPDITRFYSYAGEITCMLYERLKSKTYIEIMPAVGTHFPMTAHELNTMYPGIPHELFKRHDWKNDIVRIGTIPSEIIKKLTNGLVDFPLYCEINKTIIEGRWDQIISVGQLVPHELVGIANYNKNLFIGVGGKDIIDKTHFIGAKYGSEKLIGHVSSPVRKVLDYMSEHFTSQLPISYILTVRGMDDKGRIVSRGIFAGNDVECYLQGAALCQQVNINLLDKEYNKVVVYLDPEEFKSTWVGNKAIFRTRMAVTDGGELIVLCPGINTFGEDPTNDLIIRKYGYQNGDNLLRAFNENGDLDKHMTPLSHLLISSAENRFKVTYGVKNISQKEIESVHCNYADYNELEKIYNPFRLMDGENVMPDGEVIYYVSKPAQGLWAEVNKFNRNDRND